MSLAPPHSRSTAAPLTKMALAPEKLRRSNLLYALCGSISGVVARTATAPFERLKLLSQVSSPVYRGGGVLESLSFMVRTEGPMSLLRGNMLSCVKAVPSSAVKYVSQEALKRHFSRSSLSPVTRKLLVGGLSGAITTAATHPLEVLRTRITLGDGRQSALRLARSMSVPELFKGMVPALVGVAPFHSINYAVYEGMKELCEGPQSRIRRSKVLRSLAPSFYGVVSGAVTMTLLYPLDVVKRTVMADKECSSFAGAISKIVRRRGIKGFYAGLLPSYLKVVPNVAINWTTYELAKRAFSLA